MPGLNDELLKLRRMLLTMSAEVEQRVQQASEALLKQDVALAEHVKGGDDEIDQLDLSVEAECVEIIALHHPMACDLRYVLAALRINADLERIADLARGIAKRAIKLKYLKPVPRPPALVEMCASVRGMLADALQAVSEQDANAAFRIRARDREVDDLYKELFAWAVEQVSLGASDVRAIFDLLSAVRSLERIGDIAKNIAEATVFSAEGTVVRHAPIAGPSASV